VDMSGVDLRGAELATLLMENVNLSGANLRDASMNILYISKADLTGASLQGLKYDPFTLRYLAAAELDGAQMSESFKADLEQLHNPPET